MSVDSQTVKRVAHLARIKVTDEAAEALQGELNTILGFVEQLGEVDVSGVVDAALEAGKRVALPRIENEQLTLREIDGSTELEEGAFGVSEPPQSCALVADRDVQFILTPGLAFDPRGYRLGYGGGYYDLLLPRLSTAIACAVGFDFQLVSELPNMDHDVPVGIVVTDARIVRA